MPPYFGPLSADEPTLKGHSKNEALSLIRRKIRQAIKHLAPLKPDRRLPHNPLHKETGLWFYLGTAPWGRNHAGRWYQIVCILSHKSHSSTNFFCVVHLLRSCDRAISHTTHSWAVYTKLWPQEPLRHASRSFTVFWRWARWSRSCFNWNRWTYIWLKLTIRALSISLYVSYSIVTSLKKIDYGFQIVLSY